MRSVLYHKFGGVDVIELGDIPKPVINEKEILIRVKAASINPLDWKYRKGEMKVMSGSKFPQFVGNDFSGVVESVGVKIFDFKVGDDVFGYANRKKSGAMQEYVAVDPGLIVHKPSNITYEQAAAIPMAGMAAYAGLERKARIKKGQSILINGCTGGVGVWAVQIAAKNGAFVTGVCDARNTNTAKKLGCTDVFDYKKTNVLEMAVKYDFVYDLATKFDSAHVKNILKPGGVYLDPTPKVPQILYSLLWGGNKPGMKYRVILTGPDKTGLEQLANYAKSGFEIIVAKTFSVAQVKDAFIYAEKGGYVGKIVVTF